MVSSCAMCEGLLSKVQCLVVKFVKLVRNGVWLNIKPIWKFLHQPNPIESGAQLGIWGLLTTAAQHFEAIHISSIIPGLFQQVNGLKYSSPISRHFFLLCQMYLSVVGASTWTYVNVLGVLTETWQIMQGLGKFLFFSCCFHILTFSESKLYHSWLSRQEQQYSMMNIE